MKRISALKALFLSSMFALCSFSIGCGSSATSTRPISASVQSTANPLVAQLSVASPCSGQAMAEFGTDTSYGRTTSWYPIYAVGAIASQPTQIFVAGMKATTLYHMRAQVQCPDGIYPSQDLTFTTGPLPSLSFPTFTVTRPSPSPSSPENSGVEMIDVTSLNTPPLVTDRNGNTIWYYDVGPGNFTYPFKPLANGHMMLNVAPATALIAEIDLAGNVIRQMTLGTLQQKMQAAGFNFIPATIHHDFLPLNNGHVILLTNFPQNVNATGYGNISVVGDGLIDLDQNWNPVWAWNSFDYLDINRHLNGLPDWTHSNALVYSPSDGNLLLSMRHQSWVLKIDYNNGAGTGAILWRLGYQGDFALTANGIPSDDPSQWFSFQHYPSIVTQNGSQTTLAVWDNGDNRPLDTQGTICGAAPAYTPCYSRATVFELDEGAMVANLAWADTPGLFGVWGGSINQLSNGNVEFDLNAPLTPPQTSVASEIQEVTQSATPQVVWQMQISPLNETAYRAYRIPSLYPGVSWQN